MCAECEARAGSVSQDEVTGSRAQFRGLRLRSGRTKTQSHMRKEAGQ